MMSRAQLTRALLRARIRAERAWDDYKRWLEEHPRGTRRGREGTNLASRYARAEDALGDLTAVLLELDPQAVWDCPCLYHLPETCDDDDLVCV